MTTIYYGAYGANLNQEQMRIRCPAAKPLEGICLVDRMLVFRGVADIIAIPGNTTAVGIYAITKACERSLDRYEDYPCLYFKEYLDVQLNCGPSKIMIYVMGERYGFGKPADEYFKIIHQGYDDWEFDRGILFSALQHSINNDRGTSYRSPRWNDKTAD